MSAFRVARYQLHSVSRRTILTGGAVSALAVLAACSSNSASRDASSGASPSSKGIPENTAVPSELDSGMGSGQADGVFPRTVVHQQGETTINAAPAKVVVISTGQADAMLALGMCPMGSTTASGAEDPVAQYLKDAYPEQASAIEAIVKVGSRTEPDIEAIGALKPDLILTNKAGKDDADTLYKNLTAIAPTVVMRGTGQFWKIDFLLLADALGKREAARSLLETFRKESAEAGSALSSVGTISLLRKNGEKLRVFGPASFAGSVVADMGLQRPDAQQFTDGVSQELSSETLDKADGDWLFYGVQGDKDEELTGQALWGSLKAVGAGHAVKVDDDPFFLNAGPTAARVVRDQIGKAIQG
ncbi:MAG: iron-siderophore ABC transporter substrate-binding protein [Propionibacterium sp.]|nr:iron-siderophore ABC transporter substrate-binding protein [Propionibacterium sp.]